MYHKIGIYLTDEYIFITFKNNIYKEPIKKGIIIDNRIAISDDFYKIFSKTLKKHKILDLFGNKTLYFLQMPNYLKSDQELILSLCDKISLNKVKFIKYEELISKNTLNINTNNSYIYLKDKPIFIPHNIFVTDKFTNNIKKYIGNYKHLIKELFLFGNYGKLLNLAELIENSYNFKVYIYNNPCEYIINQLKKQLI